MKDRADSLRTYVVAEDPAWLALRQPGKPEVIAAGITLAVALGCLLFLVLFDWNWVRGPIGRAASASTGREVLLNGDLDVRLFSWTPSASVRRLSVSGPAWARGQNTAEVEQLDVAVRLRRLFLGQIEVTSLTVTRPVVHLIVDDQGRRSWDLNPDRPDDGQGARLPVIQSLVINEGRLTLDEQRRGMKLDAMITAREARSPEDGESGFLLDGKGTMNGAPLTLRVTGGPFINIRRDRPYGFTADLAGAGSRLQAKGAITRPFDLGRFNAVLELEGQDLADIYLLTGITTPNTPPYKLSGNLSRNGSLFRFADFGGRVGSSDLSGTLEVNKVGERRRVDADLTSRSLDIDDLAAVLGARPRVTSGGTVATSGKPGKLLPDAPLRTERLRTMDGALTYRAGSVKTNAFDIRQVSLGADLKDGILTLNPVSFTFNRGELNGTARIDANRSTPYSAIDFRLSGYPLESIIPARDGAPTVTGRALGRAKLEGPGASIHELAANSKGTISLVVPQGRMRSAFAELLGINVGAGVRKLLSGDQSTSDIRCAVAEFTVVGGVATSRTFVIDTDVVLAQGTGTIDLGAETLNLRLDGETKKPRLLRVWAPITVRGPLASPRLGVDASAVATQGGLVGALATLVNPVAALLGFIDPGLAEDADCGALIASAR
ncbi:AsmA family protein [Brevundimonas pondensis]|uniref:AsmA family protein n=1 Tax=Brevundimonas pondensis TaxID=2774189 RepID=UPI001CEC2C51|nr:AsmA family protein [Brevundimonas pondensis]